MVKLATKLGVLTLLSSTAVLSAHALTLSETLTKVYTENPVIAKSWQTVEQQKAALTQARADFIPDVTGVGSYADRTLDRTGADEETHTRQLGVQARQSLFHGGSVVYGWRAAKMGVQSASAAHEGTTQSVLLESIQSYINLITAQNVENVQRNQVKLLQEQLNATTARFKQGEVTKTDVKQSEARLASAKADYVQAQGDRQVAQATLDRLLGEPAENLSWPTLSLALPDSMESALDVAMNTHPDVLAALAKVTQTRYQKVKAQGSYFPQIDAVASSMNVDTDETKGYRDNSFGVEMTWQLFTGGAVKGAVDSAVAAKASAEEDYEQARRTVKENLTQAYHNHATSLAVLESREAEEKAAALAEEGVAKENKLGERTVLDLLDARQELLQARVNRIRAKGTVLTTAYALRAAMGNLSDEVNVADNVDAGAGATEEMTN